MRVAYIEDQQKWLEGFEFSTEVRVRFSETDMYGHVNNTKVFAYFEFARVEYIKEMKRQGCSLMTDPKNIIVVANLQCDYLRQCYFDDLLTVYVKTASIGTSSFDLHYLVKNEKDEICYTGRGTIVSVHLETGRPMPVSEQDRQILLGK